MGELSSYFIGFDACIYDACNSTRPIYKFPWWIYVRLLDMSWANSLYFCRRTEIYGSCVTKAVGGGSDSSSRSIVKYVQSAVSFISSLFFLMHHVLSWCFFFTHYIWRVKALTKAFDVKQLSVRYMAANLRAWQNCTCFNSTRIMIVCLAEIFFCIAIQVFYY